MAHPLRTTAILFDIGERGVRAEVQLPLDQLELALQRPLVNRAASLVATDGVALGAYVAGHTRVTARDGRPCAISVGAMRVAQVEGAPSLVVELALAPPAGAPTDQLALHYDGILHRVDPHQNLRLGPPRFANRNLSDQPKLVDVLAFQHEDTAIDQSQGSAWRGFRAVFGLGMRHIEEGTDHLLFLLVLLLPAPLRARGGRWARGSRSRRASPPRRDRRRQLAASLAGRRRRRRHRCGGRFGGVDRVVDACVSAVHAARPLFAGAQQIVAAGFGLVHGLALASALADLGFERQALGLGILGFNLGIEAMRLAVIALVMPWLLLLGARRRYARVRLGGAAFGGLAAIGWALERALGSANPLGKLIAFAAARPLVVATALAASAIFVTLRARQRSNTPRAVTRARSAATPPG